MKTLIKNLGGHFGIIFLAIIFFLGFGCATSNPTPDPLTGFHRGDEANMDKNKAITDDYKDYLQKLPAKQKGYMGTILFYENETGQHAVSIQIFEGYKNASWQHVLIYDKNNIRIKTVRYDHIKYQS